MAIEIKIRWIIFPFIFSQSKNDDKLNKCQIFLFFMTYLYDQLLEAFFNFELQVVFFFFYHNP